MATAPTPAKRTGPSETSVYLIGPREALDQITSVERNVHTVMAAIDAGAGAVSFKKFTFKRTPKGSRQKA